MKKIFLIILSFFILTQNLNANRDRVRNVNYSANLGGDIQAEIKTINTACPSNAKLYKGSIKRILTTNSNVCRNSGNSIVCAISISNSGVPNNIYEYNLSLSSRYSEVLKTIGVPEKFYSGADEIYSLTNKIELSLTTSSVGNSLGNGTTKPLNVYKVLPEIKYKDESECVPRECKTTLEIEEMKKNKANLDGITECKTEINKTQCSGECNSKMPDIKTGINPGKIGKFGIADELINSGVCSKKLNHFYCYASDKLKFDFYIERTGDGIDNMLLSINNENNTSGLSNSNYPENYQAKSYTKDITLGKENFTKTGTYTLVLQGSLNNNPAYNTNAETIKLTITPNPNTINGKSNNGDFKFETRRNNGIPTAIGNPYANLKDEYKYIFDVKDGFGNQIDNNKFSGLTYTGVSTPTPVGGKHWVQLDQVGAVNGSNKDISFVVFSGQPGEYTEKFNVKLKHWNPDGSLSGRNIETLIPSVPNKRNFKEVIDSLKIEVKEPKSNTWDGSPQVGTEQNYRLLLQDIKENGNTVLLGGNISNGKVTGGLKDKVKFVGDSEGKYKFTEFNQIGNSFTFNPENVNLQFTALFDVLAQNEFLKTPSLGIKSKEVEVNYDIRNGNRSYNGAKSLLSEIGINSCEVPTVGVKIIGNMQNFGKDGTTATNKFTDISKSDMAGIVSKNANDLIRNMKSGTTVNGVRYEVKNVTIPGDLKGEKNVNISGDLQEETLIVKGGNVFINNNLNTSGKKLGIIVLSENGKGGNIFVTNNVSNINAFIYAEGSIRSAKDENGTQTYEDKDLLNKLDIKGSLFTKNTIGGAINSGEGFLLPGGVKTTDFKEAQKYDLNFMRKVPFSCSWSEEEKANYYSVKIEYDQKIQSNPPKGFTK